MKPARLLEKESGELKINTPNTFHQLSGLFRLADKVCELASLLDA